MEIFDKNNITTSVLCLYKTLLIILWISQINHYQQNL